MAKVIWSVLCRKGILDKYTNSVSLIDVIEAVETSRKPQQFSGGAGPDLFFGMTLVILLKRNNSNVPESPLCRVKVISPSKKSHVGPEVRLDLETAGKSRFFARIPNLPITETGTLKFQIQEKISNKWRTIGTSLLDATVKDDEPSSTEPAQPS